MSKIVIIGAGAMGSAFSYPCIDNSHQVSLIGSPLEDKVIEQISKKNKFHRVLGKYLPKKLNVLKVDRLSEMLADNPHLIVVGVNSQGIEWAAEEIAFNYNGKTPILLLTKGLSLKKNLLLTMSQKLKENLHNHMNNYSLSKKLSITSVAGPCLAKDLANKAKTCVLFANEKFNDAKKIRNFVKTNYYDIECSKNRKDIEICAAIKNFYSMIIGSAKDLNTSSFLFHKSVLEMKKVLKLWGNSENIAFGLAGLADLHVSSAGGRNSKMGKLLGKGYLYSKAKSKFMQNETVEGAELAFELAPKLLNSYTKKNLPLMYSLVKSIYHNTRLNIKF